MSLSDAATMTAVETERKGAFKGYTFARHETFHLRDGWLMKAMQSIEEDGASLHASDAHHTLGMGINMLKSLKYWIRATNLVEPVPNAPRVKPPYQFTKVGDLIYEFDPYLEDLGTLWLLHIELVSNPQLATFWYWAFNELPHRSFIEDRMLQAIQRYLSDHSVMDVAYQSLVKDSKCFLRTYVPATERSKVIPTVETIDCPLAMLGLVGSGIFPGQYKFMIGEHKNLPLDLFAYCLFRYRERASIDQTTVSLEDLRWAPFSPGRVLCLDTRTLLNYLEELEVRTKKVRVVRTAGLSLASLDEDVRAIDLLRGYYSTSLVDR